MILAKARSRHELWARPRPRYGYRNGDSRLDMHLPMQPISRFRDLDLRVAICEDWSGDSASVSSRIRAILLLIEKETSSEFTNTHDHLLPHTTQYSSSQTLKMACSNASCTCTNCTCQPGSCKCSSCNTESKVCDPGGRKRCSQIRD